MHNQERIKSYLIIDSITGLNCHLSDPNVYIYHFLNYLSLLFQERVFIVIWRDKSPIFSTITEPFFHGKHDIKWKNTDVYCTIGETPYFISLYKISDKYVPNPPGNREHEALLENLLTLDTKKMLCLKKISNNSSIINNNEMLERSIKIIDETGIRNRHYELPSNVIDLTEEEVGKMLAPLRKAIDHSFSESSKSEYIRPDGIKNYFTNIFASIKIIPREGRRFNSFYPYTYKMLLSEIQQNQFREWHGTACETRYKQCYLARKDPALCQGNIEKQLSYSSSSIADWAFCTGVIDFSGKEDNIWNEIDINDTGELGRLAAEKCFYPSNVKILRVPIHIGGVPWLMISTLSRESTIDSWNYNYLFYRDVLIKATSLLREKVFDIYTDLIYQALERQIRKWSQKREKTVETINQDWQKIAQIYPLPLLSLSQAKQGAIEEMYVSGRGKYYFKWQDNPFFARQVRWGIYDADEIINTCKERLKSFAKLEDIIEHNAIAHTSHLLKQPVNQLIIGIENDRSGDHIKALGAKIELLSMFAEAMISEEKKHKFLRENVEILTSGDIIRMVQKSVLDFTEAQASITETEITRTQEDMVKTLCNMLDTDRKARTYQPLITVAIEGLLSNAGKYINKDRPFLKLSLQVSNYLLEDGSKTMLDLVVSNNTIYKADDLAKVIENCNIGGPDIIGVTNLYWACRTCWGDKFRPRWRQFTNDGAECVEATIPIAEVL